MSYNFKEEYKAVETNPLDILNIINDDRPTVRKVYNKDCDLQNEYKNMGIILSDLGEIFKKVPTEDVANLDFARGYSICETVYVGALHSFFKKQFDVEVDDIDIIFSVKDNLAHLEIVVEKDGKVLFCNKDIDPKKPRLMSDLKQSKIYV
ncbi:MAG: hypothetical protein HOF44_11280 [Pelagibacterales bacterium]|jgi:hypothetical protein|nr:hypothetical protein [Pelagibacterales bacterium]